MRTVRDRSGTRYLLLKRSADTSLVREPETGERRHLPNEELEPVEGAAPLETAAAAVPDAVRRLLTAVPDERALGLLVELDARGPLPVRDLVAATELCESDLHGAVAELRAAGLLAEARVAGERAYDTTEVAGEALSALR